MAAGLDTYTGSYMLNAADAPRVGAPLMLPKFSNQEESLGDVTQELIDVLPKLDPFIKPSRCRLSPLSHVCFNTFHPYGCVGLMRKMLAYSEVDHTLEEGSG
jgi:hypothetical protein